jgi:mycofactocin precursor
MQGMEKDTTVTAEQNSSQSTGTETVASAEAELLVEEISIDGMCGVY